MHSCLEDLKDLFLREFCVQNFLSFRLLFRLIFKYNPKDKTNNKFITS